MRCVSYTRMTCFDPTAVKIEDPIRVQNEHIAAYAKSRHRKIHKRYSDLKDDPKADAGFKKMKDAAMKREFDCVFMDSITRFGPDVYQSICFLKNTYYPAGLHFAVVEDDFFSAEHADEEVFTYLTEKRAFIHGRLAIGKTEEYAVANYFSSYGLRYFPEEHRVERDEDSARIIVEVFERMRAGETPKSIAEDMTRRGIENPSHYYYRQRGWKQRRKDPSWTIGNVRAITKNPKYIGTWECKYDISRLDIRCGAIVDTELYEAVQEAYASRFDHLPGRCRPLPYANLMQDKETGMKIRYFNNTRTKHSDVRFSYPKEHDIQYDRPYMPYDEFHKKVTEQMILEKKSASNALSVIKSETGARFRNGKMQSARNRFQSILTEMNLLENQKIDAYRQYENGETDKECYLQREAVIAQELKKLNEKVEPIIAELTEINTIYSDKNPWIRRFIGFDEKDALVRKKVVKLVSRVDICRFESVELIPMKSEWKQALPAEWMEGKEHVENE